MNKSSTPRILESGSNTLSVSGAMLRKMINQKLSQAICGGYAGDATSASDFSLILDEFEPIFERPSVSMSDAREMASQLKRLNQFEGATKLSLARNVVIAAIEKTLYNQESSKTSDIQSNDKSDIVNQIQQAIIKQFPAAAGKLDKHYPSHYYQVKLARQIQHYLLNELAGLDWNLIIKETGSGKKTAYFDCRMIKGFIAQDPDGDIANAVEAIKNLIATNNAEPLTRNWQAQETPSGEHTSITGKPDTSLPEAQLSDFLAADKITLTPQKRDVISSSASIQRVAERVAEFYGVNVEDLNQRLPLPEDSPAKKAREVAVYLVDKHFKPKIRDKIAIFGQGNENFTGAIRKKTDQLILASPDSEIPEAIGYLEEELGLASAEVAIKSPKRDR